MTETLESRPPRSPRSSTHRAIQRLCRHVEGMHVGVPLPPVAQLRRDLGVSQQTIEKAYDHLEERGLIHRHRGKGVFRADPTAIGEFAIVIRKQSLGAEASPAYRLSATALIEQLHAENQQWHSRLHVALPTDDPTQSVPPDLLSDDLLPKLRGVFAYQNLIESDGQLQRHHIPVVHMSARNGTYRVGADREGFLRQSILHLRSRGCRRLGMIWAISPRASHPTAARDELFMQLLKEYGLESRESWIQGRRAATWTEADGHDLFQTLWHQDERPDGVIIDDDVLSQGVLRATLRLGIDLPRDLKLMSFANRGASLPYHKSVTRIEFDHRQWAKLAVTMMSKLVRGQTVSQPIVRMSGTLIEGDTA